jgi:ketosteroid isomerase-like protein
MRWIVALAATALLAPAGEATNGAALPGHAARAELRDADRAQARAVAADGFARGFTPFLADDAVYLPPDLAPLHGVPAIRAYLDAAFPHVTHYRRTPARVDVSASGDVGYTFGWTVTTTDSGVAHGKYLAGWTRGPGGDWRLAVYLPNASPGPAEDVPPWFRDRVEGEVRGTRPEGAAAPATAVVEADRAFADLALSAGTAEAFGRYAAPLAVAVANGGGMIYGPDAIRAAYTFPDGYVLRWAPEAGTASAAGDLGFTWGLYELEVPDSAGVVTRHGKYLSLWERQPSGDWRFAADGGNSGPVP